MSRHERVQAGHRGPGQPASATRLNRLGSGQPNLRNPLLLVLIAGAIPVLLFAGWIAYQDADRQRSAARMAARAVVERVGERITAEMSAQVQVAETLALSAALDEPDLATFYREAQRLREARPLWHTVELNDPNGEQLLNLLRPFGPTLGPTADRESFDQALANRRSVVGGIGPVGAISERRLVALHVPVVRGGDLRHVLTVSFVPDAIGAILSGAGAPEGWVGDVVDGRGSLIARSVAEQPTPGQPASATLRQAVVELPGGFYRGRTAEGLEIETVFEMLTATGGWSVHLGVPSEVLDRPIRRSLYAVAGGVAASLALATGLAGLVSRDIGRRREEDERAAAIALHASEERAALATAAAELGTWRWDMAGNKVFGSERCGALLGLPKSVEADAIWSSATFLAAVHADDRDRVQATFRQSVGEQHARAVEFRVAGEGGEPRWLRAIGRARALADGSSEILGVVADITARKRAEAERLDLLRRLSDAQEKVQGGIARELHDQVGQTVAGLSLGLKALERALEELGVASSRVNGFADASDLREHVRWLQGAAAEIGRDIHRAAAQLRPTALDDVGLSRALAAQAVDWSRRSGVSADVQVVGEDESRLPPAIETVVYRVVQEALTNILKHAQARHVSVVLERRPRELRVIIEDDGVGFDPSEAEAQTGFSDPARPHLGLLGMRERLALVGGSLRLESARGAGATLFVRIPLDPLPEGSTA